MHFTKPSIATAEEIEAHTEVPLQINLPARKRINSEADESEEIANEPTKIVNAEVETNAESSNGENDDFTEVTKPRFGRVVKPRAFYQNECQGACVSSCKEKMTKTIKG